MPRQRAGNGPARPGMLLSGPNPFGRQGRPENLTIGGVAIGGPALGQPGSDSPPTPKSGPATTESRPSTPDDTPAEA
jgi:hypothetical protein